jgi:flagellar hook-basal body complex protein FliE
MASPLSAVGAYAAMQSVGASALASQISRSEGQAQGGLAGSPLPNLISNSDAGAAKGGFAGALQQFVGNTAESARHAEASMVKATAGKGDLVDVVTAIAESEAALETLVAVRDRVVAAYEEIMRMPI